MPIPLGLARVHGRSMEPTLVDGDRLLVRYGATPSEGDVVVVRLPKDDDGAERPLAVKRAAWRQVCADGTPGWWVERDNPTEGVDSWLVGTIPDADVLAVMWTRLPRIPGWLPSGPLAVVHAVRGTLAGLATRLGG